MLDFLFCLVFVSETFMKFGEVLNLAFSHNTFLKYFFHLGSKYGVGVFLVFLITITQEVSIN